VVRNAHFRWHVVPLSKRPRQPKSPVSPHGLILLGKSIGKPHRNHGELPGSGVDFPKTNLLIATNLVSSPPGHAWDLGDPARPKITPVRSIKQPSSCGFYVPYFSVLHPLSSMVHTHIFIYTIYIYILILGLSENYSTRKFAGSFYVPIMLAQKCYKLRDYTEYSDTPIKSRTY